MNRWIWWALFWLSIAIALLGARAACADDPVQRELPLGRTIAVDGIQYKAYTLDEYKVVAEIYVGYLWLWKGKALVDQRLVLQTQIEEAYELRLANCNDTVAMLQADQAFWRKRVTEEMEARTKVERLAVLERYGLWGLVLAEALAVGVLGVYAYAHSY